MQLVQCAEPASRIGADLRVMLTAYGPGDDVLGGVGLLGLRLPGLDLVIDAVLLLPRGIVVIGGVDLPGPALRLEAPPHGSWRVDGWRLTRPGSPAGGTLAATGAVGARLESPGTPDLPVAPLVIVGPYVREVAGTDGGPVVLHPTPTRLLRTMRRLADASALCDAGTAAEVLRLLAPTCQLPLNALTAEGFVAGPAEVSSDRAARRGGRRRIGRWGR